MKFTRFFVLFLALVLVPLVAQATTYTTFVATPSRDAVSSDASTNYPELPIAFSRTSVANVATTTAQTVTALAGRKKISFYLSNTQTAGVCWVHIGSTTGTIGTGIPLCNALAIQAIATQSIMPFRSEISFDLDANVPIGFVASTAVPVCVLQEGR